MAPFPDFHMAPMAFSPMSFAWDDQDREAERQDREAERKEREREREANLYEQATDQIYEGRYDKALPTLVRLIEMKGPRVDAALYWKAYAQNRIGQRAEALATIAELTKAYPNSRYVRSAKALEVEVRGAAGQTVTPDSQAMRTSRSWRFSRCSTVSRNRQFRCSRKCSRGTRRRG